MNISGILLNQIIIMFILMCIGFVFYRTRLITDQGSRDIGKILLYLVIPVVIVSNFCVEKTAENSEALLHSTVISALSMFLAVLVSYLVFKRKNGIAEFSSSFSNAGFIGISLVQATLGSSAVFYISTMIVLVNILQWTVGVFMITGDTKSMKPRMIIRNPIVISVAIGLLIYFLQIPVGATAKKVFSLISGLNTPLAMMVSGVYLAQADLPAMLKKKSAYQVAFLRLILIPLITVLVFWLLPFGSQNLKLAILIAAACPVGSNVAVFAQAYDKDYREAVEQVCLTTILCLITLPLIIQFASRIF